MKTQPLPDSVVALNRILNIAGLIMTGVVLAAIGAKLLGWIRDPLALLLRLPLLALIPCLIVISGISAEIVVMTRRGCLPSGANWSERTHFRSFVVLWILFAVSQIVFLIRFRPN